MKEKIVLVLTKAKEALISWINEGFKTRKLEMAGFCFTWLVPLISIISFLCIHSTEYKRKIPLWLIITLVIVAIIYVKKIKSILRDKMLVAKLKNIPICPLYYIINGGVTVLIIWLAYWLVDIFSNWNLIELQRYLVICMASVACGSLCYSAHAINSLKPDEVDSEGHTHDN